MADVIKIEVLPDGTLKIETDKVSMPNHAGAEAMIREMLTEMGGESTRSRKGHGMVHGHTHDGHHHEHDH